MLKINKNRVIVYIDGFNLYFGMVDAGIDNGLKKEDFERYKI